MVIGAGLGWLVASPGLLLTRALIMCAFLITSSVVVAMLIPSAEFGLGGAADGRALAWLPHEYLGQWFGTAYDWVTVGILWFAGVSAMAGLLTLLPRYLPRFGMASGWARRSRPMVAVFTVIAVLITLVSGAVGVTLLSHGRERIFTSVTTTVLSITLVAISH